MIHGAVARRLPSSGVVVDWLPVLLVPPVQIADAALSPQGKPITVLSVLATIVGCLPLVARRHVRFPILAPGLVAGVVLILWQLHPGDTVVLVPMVALHQLALSNDRRRNLWMALAVVPCVVVSILPFANGLSHLAPLVVRNLALCLLAIAAGDVIRSRRMSTQRLMESAEQRTLRRVGEERLRIARDIHDLVAHAMTAINVQAGVAAHLLERDPQQAHDALRAIKDVSGQALADLRGTLEVLRDPAAAAPLGPAAGLGDLAPLVERLRAAGVEVELEVEGVGDVPAAVQGAGYRIVQEAMTNIARHAGASRAQIHVRRLPGHLAIDVGDDGRGAPAANGTGPGNGLRGMLERAAALGGSLEAGPGERGGWRVQARLPLGGSDG